MFRLVVVVLCLVYLSAKATEIDERIVGGFATSITDFPYQVSFQYDGSHFCGGSLITRKIVLTAAHCVKAMSGVDLSLLKIRLGSTNWSTGGALKGVEAMKAHPNYDPNTMQYDVALVKLDSAVTYSDSIQNITMAVNEPVDGGPAVISGWGTKASGATTLPSILQAAYIKFILRDTCRSRTYSYGTSVKSTMICAGASGKDSCQGDSGGPLVGINTGRLVGVVSWGQGCAEAGYPGVYSDVTVLRPWIVNAADAM